MAKFTFLLLFCCSFTVFSQEYQIQLRLVDSQVGYPTGDPIDDDYSAVSNDEGLNAIFQNYSATHYYPGDDFIPEWQNRTHFVLCDGCDINQFEQDLLNYDAVIAGTFQSEPYLMANNLYVKLLDANNGNPTGDTTSEGNVITTNAAMNTLFETHNVVYFENSYAETYYHLGCNCIATDLYNELNSLADVIENVDFAGYVVLNTPSYEALDFKLYPNPVGDNISINSSEKINSYEIISPLGQSLIKGNSEAGINEYLPSLSTGTYFLKVNTDAGKTQILRFIKK